MIDREVILDLLPLYRAGLGSPATRALVEAYLAAHPEPAAEPAEEGRWRESLAQARRLSRARRYWFGAALALTALSLAIRIHFEGGRLVEAHLLAMETPLLFAPLVAGAAVAWIVYWRLTRNAGG